MKKKVGLYIGGIVLIVIMGAIIYQFVETLHGDREWASTYTALGTLALAFVTFLLALSTVWSVTNSNAQEKRRGEAALARENRDRKERLLNEVIEWAIDVGKRGSDIDFVLLAAEIDEEPWGKLNLPTLQSNFRELKQRGEYVVKVVSTMEEPLSNTVLKVESEVKEYLNAIDQLFIKTRLEGTEGNLTTLFRPLIERESLVQIVNDLLAEATKHKTENIS